MCEREMATTRSNSREERRRKIVDRGTDRLALIRGRTQSLPTSDHHLHYDAFNQSPPPSFKDHTSLGPESSGNASCSRLLNRETDVHVSRANTFDIGNQVEAPLHKYETDKEVKSEPLQAKSLGDEKLSTGTKPIPEPSRTYQLNLFSSKQVNSCIIASQGTRSFCALMIALLVVLSYVDYPLFRKNIVSSEGIVASRPLYILLLTDVTIVLAQLYLEERRHSEEAEKGRVVSEEDGCNLTGAVKVMERSLVVYQSLRAFLIDFSIYIVVVVCGLSLL